MKILKFLFGISFAFLACFGAHADSLFFESEPIQAGIEVFKMSRGFADIYSELDSVSWAGKNINVAIESLENIHQDAHIAATDERVILVWRDEIVANYPRPNPRDWDAYGEITTALVLKMRERDTGLRTLEPSYIYNVVLQALMHSIDENGRYISPSENSIFKDDRILTSVGIEGARDERGNFRVFGVYNGSPADVAGIMSGDLIGEINGTLVAELSDSDLASMLSGFDSGTLKMTLMSPSGNRRVVVRRATIVIADADIVFMDDDNGGVLYIVVNKVSEGAVTIIKEALKKYKDLNGIILDLRAASGDDEITAAKMAGLFVGSRPVMRIVETARDETEVVPTGAPLTNAPIVVVLSNMTRGTAEAIAATIYENGRGVLIGTPSAGIGRIASKIELVGGGALELLNKSIKTGAGRVIDSRGVFPIVCLANIRTSQQQNAFFLNVINNDFHAKDFNSVADVDVAAVRRACPVITSGEDEDALSLSVGAKILTDRAVYNRLLNLQQ